MYTSHVMYKINKTGWLVRHTNQWLLTNHFIKLWYKSPTHASKWLLDETVQWMINNESILGKLVNWLVCVRGLSEKKILVFWRLFCIEIPISHSRLSEIEWIYIKGEWEKENETNGDIKMSDVTERRQLS